MTFLTRLLCALAFSALLALPATSVADDDDDAAPSAGPVVASAVTQDSARVTGVVTLGRKNDAHFWFEYGTVPALGKYTTPAIASHDADDSNHRVTVTRTLTGLPAGTRHYVRLVAMDTNGRGTGPTTSFTTAAATQPPSTAPTPGHPSQPGNVPPAGPAQAAPPAPELGKSVVVAEAGGSVRVKPRGADKFVPLDAAASIPVGSVVDARRGSVSLSAARNAAGAVQDGSFGGSRFVVRQPRHGHGYTNLYLRGGGIARCGDRGGRAVASTAANRRKRVRSLWGKDRGGRFRTHGRDSVATVRGTRWKMTDRCDGTMTKVTEGAVDVKVRRTGRIVRVRAGEHHLARHRR